MELKIIQVGASLGVVIPKSIIDYLKLEKGQKIEIDLKIKEVE